MARGRFVSKKISDSKRVNSLPEPAQLLFTWMIPHLDCEGRILGEAKLLNSKVFPLKDYADEEIDQWLELMEASKDPLSGEGLILRYEVNGHQFICCPGFASEQSSKGGTAWKERETPSEIPPPPLRARSKVKVVSKEPSKASDEILDKKLKAIATCYEDNIGVLTPSLFERLKGISDDYPDGWFKKAVDEALVYNKRNLKYIEKILERWKVDGLGHGKDPLKPGTPIKGLAIEE